MCTRFKGNIWKPNFCQDCQRDISKHKAELNELKFSCPSKEDDSDLAENVSCDVVDATLDFMEIRRRPNSVRILGPVSIIHKQIKNDVESTVYEMPEEVLSIKSSREKSLIDDSNLSDLIEYYGSSELLNILLEKIDFEGEIEFNFCRIIEKLTLLNSTIIKMQTLYFESYISFSSNYKIVAGTENYIVWFSKKDGVFQILSDKEFVLLDSFEDVIQSVVIKTKKNKNSYNYGVKVKANSIRTFEQWSLKEKYEKFGITSVFYFLIQMALSLQKLSSYSVGSLNMNDLLVISSNDNFDKMLIFAFVGDSNGDFTEALNMVKYFTYENSKNISKKSKNTNCVFEAFQQILTKLETFISDKATTGSTISLNEFKGHMNAYNFVMLFTFHLYKLNSEEYTNVKSKIKINDLICQIFCNAMLFHTDIINLLLSSEHVDTKQILLNSQLVLMLLETYSFYHP